MSKLTELKERMKKTSKFAQLDKDKINFLNPPYSLRNDCQIGQWKVGDSELLGNEIEVSILKVNPAEGKLGKSSGSWLQVWFVASPNETKLPKKIVCVTYLKTRSASSFSNKLMGILGKDEIPELGFWKLGFEKHSGETGTYYSVKPEWRAAEEKEVEFLEKVADFNDENIYLYDGNVSNNLIILESNTMEEVQAAKALLAENKESDKVA